ncbi:hypothetical protein BKA70DRAFT_1230843 [Coprinopsis sp. MPI-PUGE-AT-0042]|nr:hypothetical protein BKA70DRAFT_1230843 [Coprinopsis sp. MPI-PUGE-AT-0042]
MDSPPRCRTPTQPLPRDLSATIAAAVVASLHEDDKWTRRCRNLTLKNCILVSQSFAYEFRPYLYESLYIVDSQSHETQELSGDRLCDHVRTIQERPEYQRLVKKVFISLDPDPARGKELRRSLVNLAEFPSFVLQWMWKPSIAPELERTKRCIPESFVHKYRSQSRSPRLSSICIDVDGGWGRCPLGFDRPEDWRDLDKVVSSLSGLERVDLILRYIDPEIIEEAERQSITFGLLPSLHRSTLDVQLKPYTSSMLLDWT